MITSLRRACIRNTNDEKLLAITAQRLVSPYNFYTSFSCVLLMKLEPRKIN